MGAAKSVELASEEVGPSDSLQVNTEELIRLTEALDGLASKLDRITGIVVKLYQLTERLESTVANKPDAPAQTAGLDETVLEWINNKVAKKRRKELKKWRKKKGKRKR